MTAALSPIKELSTLKKVENGKAFFLSDLLPYDTNSKSEDLLIDGLKEYQLLVNCAKDALTALQKGDLSQFDPLVGENACQIRAIELAFIFSNTALDFTESLNELCSIGRHLDQLINYHCLIPKSIISLANLIDEEGLTFPLTNYEALCIQFHLLTVAKESIRKEALFLFSPTNSNRSAIEKIKTFGCVSNRFAEQLIHATRKRISEDSVLFVRSLADTLLDSDPDKTMLSERFIYKHKGAINYELACLPCYWTMRILMRAAFKQDIPLIIKAVQKAKDRDYETVNEAIFCFLPSPDGYKRVSLDSLDSDSASFIMYGATCADFDELPSRSNWEKAILEINPIDLILAATAAHPQYPGNGERELLSDVHDAEYERYKQKAVEWGCSLKNPSRLLPIHFYCDRMENLLANTHAIV